MPTPKEVFDNPRNFIDFITASNDADFEGQYFDRKEAGSQDSQNKITSNSLNSVKQHVIATISAFTNSNREGGLLIIGISKNGVLRGIDLLTDSQSISLTSFNEHLKCQAATTKTMEIEQGGETKKILLIYSPYCEHGLCENFENQPKAWVRNGNRNAVMSEEIRNQIKRDKKITNFERTICCKFDINEVDNDVLNEFKLGFLGSSTLQLTVEEVLYQAGALEKIERELYFNNAGYLFFGQNPQRHLPYAYIRLLRFNATSNNYKTRGINNFDKPFDGPLPQQIRKWRTFFKESGFFKTLTMRDPKGAGFIESPEFPPIAIDEAIVNAVAHRDYGIQLPIECYHYKDAFVVQNPGRVIQRDKDMPDEFSLDYTTLDSMPRNSKLIEWLKLMKDEKGSAFVRMISEGTKTMREEMIKAGLPAPLYKLSPLGTIVTLYNDIDERESRLASENKSTESPEHMNLFKLDFKKFDGSKPSPEEIRENRQNLQLKLLKTMSLKRWYIDDFIFGKIICHRQGMNLKISNINVDKYIHFFPAYTLQLREYFNEFYINIDFRLVVKNVRNLNQLLHQFTFDQLNIKKGVANYNGWQKCKILNANQEWTSIQINDEIISVDSIHVIPDLNIVTMKQILIKENINFDLSYEIKKLSLSNEANASKLRDERTRTIAERISNEIFPITYGDIIVSMRNVSHSLNLLSKVNTLKLEITPEPVVEFNHHNETANIREGITSYGSYEFTNKLIEIIPICLQNMKQKMAELIERLKIGKYKYSGSERTFSTRFNYHSIIEISSTSEILSECQRLLNEKPEWESNVNLNRIFLIHIPEKDFAINDESSPYYQVKNFLFEKGIPCQMVDTPTLANPDWKDLNLALNVVAKCGITPWVLPDKIPDADFFIGLSYTQSNYQGLRRLLGYATVFNEFGRWEFYSGNTNTFSYDDRIKYFSLLTKETLEKLTLPNSPNIYFHYSAKFSRDDRNAILNEAKKIRPNGTYNFVSINMHHNIRLYDSRPFTDGSLGRGKYIITAQNQILLSTTGYNEYRKILGTPIPLEVTLWSILPNNTINKNPDLKSLAKQILCLTKLNWASTDSICGEPITTKYAGDIAYLTDAFLRLGGKFNLNPVLEKTPWFI